MNVCDKCSNENVFKVRVGFDKVTGKKLRRMLSINMELCEKYITLFLKEFGSFKNRFMENK
jgi:hypothetical protein